MCLLEKSVSCHFENWLKNLNKEERKERVFSLRWVRGKRSSIGFVWWLSSKGSSCQCRRHRRYEFDPWIRKTPWRRKWHATPVFLPEESHGQRSLVGYSPWGHQESDTTEYSTTDTCAHIWMPQVPGDCQSSSLRPWCHGDQTPICWIPHSALMELGTVPGVQRSLCLTFWLALVPGGRLAVLDLLIVLWCGARAYRVVWLQPEASLPDRALLSTTCHGAAGEGVALN